MTSEIKQAMVLAAGLGSRMAPLTDTTPKPLIKVAGKSLIDYALDRFEAAGLERAVVNVHYLPEQIEDHLKDRRQPAIKISDERDLLLETGGGLKKARVHFGATPVFCANTDAILIDPPGKEACASLRSMWNPDEMDALLLLVPIEKAMGYHGAGDFTYSDDGRIAFRCEDTAPFVFTGLQIISTGLVEEGPEGPFSTRLLWDLALERQRLFGAVYAGEWLHIGDPDAVIAAEERLSGKA